MLIIVDLLREMLEAGSTDLHITTGSPPQMRVDGALQKMNHPILTPDDTRALAYSLINEAQKERFERERELDFAFEFIELGSRFRANMFMQRSHVALALRAIPVEVPTIKKLGLPKAFNDLATRPNGLVLVTGPTGSGKTTSLAAMINKINTERPVHIVTMEDPIEYIHEHKRGIVNQREIGADSHTFGAALKYVLRQDPDVVLIGEMRDLETIKAAITIAQTGHLAFASLHTNSAIQTINRIIDVFPAEQQEQIRGELSFVLIGVMSQTLIPRIGGGRVLACEIMVVNDAIAACIRDDKVEQIYSYIQTGQKLGMQTFNDSLYEIYQRKLITFNHAIANSREVDELREMITGKRDDPNKAQPDITKLGKMRG